MRRNAIPWASVPKKEEAQAWVAARIGCVKWGNGLCAVNGTLVPLAFWPSLTTKAYIDCKHNASLNVQIVNLTHTLQIIDYVVGFKVSCQDARAWAASKLAQNPAKYLNIECGKFIWWVVRAESAEGAAHAAAGQTWAMA